VNLLLVVRRGGCGGGGGVILDLGGRVGGVEFGEWRSRVEHGRKWMWAEGKEEEEEEEEECLGNCRKRGGGKEVPFLAPLLIWQHTHTILSTSMPPTLHIKKIRRNYPHHRIPEYILIPHHIPIHRSRRPEKKHAIFQHSYLSRNVQTMLFTMEH